MAQSQETLRSWGLCAAGVDAGNFMWGNWMKFSQFSSMETKLGSEKNENFQDSSADQNAIKNGSKF